MLKHFLLVWLLAGLLSSCYCCGGGNGGDGGDGGDGGGGDGGDGGIGRKRTYLAKQRLFSLTFQTFDVNKDGVITVEEFLNLQPGHKRLFHMTDIDKNGVLNCAEFSREVSKFGGEPIC